MTTFHDFCRVHGVIVDRELRPGEWMRFRTDDKPSHRNGAVKFMGTHGFVQNHATMLDVAVWSAEGESKVSAQRVQQIASNASRETFQRQQEAAQKAERLLSECELKTHPYLQRKGFADEMANVRDGILMVPMRVGRDLVGVQQIDADGGKKFLFGQRTSMAEFVFSAGNGLHVLCEGFCTGLSVKAALASLKRPFKLHVCFSANNMRKVAQTLPGGIAIADNDASLTGQKVCEEIGWPYWMSDRVGEDFNDAHQRLGMFAVAQQLRKVLMSTRAKAVA